MHITLFVRILFSHDPNPYPGLGHPSPQGHDELSSQCAFCAFLRQCVCCALSPLTYSPSPALQIRG